MRVVALLTNDVVNRIAPVLYAVSFHSVHHGFQQNSIYLTTLDHYYLAIYPPTPIVSKLAQPYRYLFTTLVTDCNLDCCNLLQPNATCGY